MHSDVLLSNYSLNARGTPVSNPTTKTRCHCASRTVFAMANTDTDTDTLLAILSSLVHPLEFKQTTLLDALVRLNGDVEAAAKSLRARQPSEPLRKKRKVSSNPGLDGWLKGKGRDECASPSSASHGSLASGSGTTTPPRTSTQSSSSSPAKPSSKAKPVTNTEFLALLRPPNSSDANAKLQVARQPPLTLISPEHVAEHIPCTLHNSILPPDLACK